MCSCYWQCLILGEFHLISPFLDILIVWLILSDQIKGNPKSLSPIHLLRLFWEDPSGSWRSPSILPGLAIKGQFNLTTDQLKVTCTFTVVSGHLDSHEGVIDALFCMGSLSGSACTVFANCQFLFIFKQRFGGYWIWLLHQFRLPFQIQAECFWNLR